MITSELGGIRVWEDKVGWGGGVGRGGEGGIRRGKSFYRYIYLISTLFICFLFIYFTCFHFLIPVTITIIIVVVVVNLQLSSVLFTDLLVVPVRKCWFIYLFFLIDGWLEYHRTAYIFLRLSSEVNIVVVVVVGNNLPFF